MRRIIFSGSRRWRNTQAIRDTLAQLDPDTDIIVHGACPTGLDNLVDGYAKRAGFTVEAYPADWDRYGKPAGIYRNRTMADLPNVAHLYAFPLPGSRGTTDMIQTAQAKQIPVTLDTGD